MAKRFDQEGNELAQKLQNVAGSAEYTDIAKEALRQVLYEFFQKRIEFVLKNEEFRTFLEYDIKEMIKNDQLSATQKLSAWKFITTANNHATKILLDGVKPTPNATSNLLDSNNDYEDNDYTQNMTPSELEALNTLISVTKRKGDE